MALADEFVRVYKETHPSDPVVELRLYDVAIPEIDLDLLSAGSCRSAKSRRPSERRRSPDGARPSSA